VALRYLRLKPRGIWKQRQKQTAQRGNGNDTRCGNCDDPGAAAIG
jgi:hypothetical protein